MLNLLSIKISRFARNDKKRNCDTASKVGIYNKFKMLVLDLIGDWIPVCTGMTIQAIYGKIQN